MTRDELITLLQQRRNNDVRVYVPTENNGAYVLGIEAVNYDSGDYEHGDCILLDADQAIIPTPGQQLLDLAHSIWGDTRESQNEALQILTVALGDLARLVRDGGVTADYQREMGNLILSTARLAAAQHLDVDRCIEVAADAQRAYVAKRGTR